MRQGMIKLWKDHIVRSNYFKLTAVAGGPVYGKPWPAYVRPHFIDVTPI
jgi:hypothetical protein